MEIVGSNTQSFAEGEAKNTLQQNIAVNVAQTFNLFHMLVEFDIKTAEQVKQSLASYLN